MQGKDLSSNLGVIEYLKSIQRYRFVLRTVSLIIFPFNLRLSLSFSPQNPDQSLHSHTYTHNFDRKLFLFIILFLHCLRSLWLIIFLTYWKYRLAPTLRTPALVILSSYASRSVRESSRGSPRPLLTFGYDSLGAGKVLGWWEGWRRRKNGRWEVWDLFRPSC